MNSSWGEIEAREIRVTIKATDGMEYVYRFAKPETGRAPRLEMRHNVEYDDGDPFRTPGLLMPMLTKREVDIKIKY